MFQINRKKKGANNVNRVIAAKNSEYYFKEYRIIHPRLS